MAEAGVRFIRKNGRVIPVRTGTPLSKKLARASGASVVIGAAAGHGVRKTLAKQNMSINEMRHTYKDFFKAAGNPGVYNSPIGGTAAVFSGKLVKDASGYRRKVTTRVWLGHQRDEAAILHELGHIAKARIKGTANNWSIKGGMSTNPAERIAHKLGAPFIKLVTEAEASGAAIHAAAKAKGFKHAAKIAGKLVLPYLTYAGAAGAIGFGVAAIVQRIRERKKNG